MEVGESDYHAPLKIRKLSHFHNRSDGRKCARGVYMGLIWFFIAHAMMRLEASHEDRQMSVVPPGENSPSQSPDTGEDV